MTGLPAEDYTVEGPTRLIEKLMAAEAVPDVLHHYTDQSGFKGIATTRTLWASELRFLNDEAEFTYTIDMISNHLQDLAATFAGPGEDQMLHEWRRALDTTNKVPVYSISFSRNPDQLSQWRAYGRGAGYSIGIRPRLLMQATMSFVHPGACLRCIYKVDEQKAVLSDAITFLVNKFRSRPVPAAPDDVAHRMGFEVEFFTTALLLAACFKHQTFVEENEWRFVFRQGTPDKVVPHRDFRPAGRLLAPYLAIPLDKSGPLPRLDRVIVGPNPHKDLSLYSARALLEQNGWACDTVELSTIPYRDW